ncbi:MAG TPA: VOC family protein [Candidatus Polarisedimenticolia bacterium]|nr:VOC family protein [Candidatus Polarisedimenticolia bacterium]
MAPVRPVPEGFHTITPHLVIDGAPRAMEFYKKAFGAEELKRIPGPGGKLMHAEMKIGDSVLMLCDEFPKYGAVGPKSSSPVVIHLFVNDVDKVFSQAVAAGATAVMPPTDALWGDRYGKVTDPFGHSWSLATHKEDLTPQQIAERMKAAGM